MRTSPAPPIVKLHESDIETPAFVYDEAILAEDLDTARAALAKNQLMIMSTQASFGVEDIAKARSGPVWHPPSTTNHSAVTTTPGARAARVACAERRRVPRLPTWGAGPAHRWPPSASSRPPGSGSRRGG